jgi:hypothetical protein
MTASGGCAWLGSTRTPAAAASLKNACCHMAACDCGSPCLQEQAHAKRLGTEACRKLHAAFHAHGVIEPTGCCVTAPAPAVQGPGAAMEHPLIIKNAHAQPVAVLSGKCVPSSQQDAWQGQGPRACLPTTS